MLDEVDLRLESGDAAAVMGPSGSGKSTLLYILGALEPPTSGSVRLDGRDPLKMPEREAAAFRNREIGFIFQDHCLLPQLTALENVLAPTLTGARDPEAKDRARVLLERVGLKDRLEHKPSEMSGGEKQRAAIARALIRRPRLLLADEPTGNLDRTSAEGVASLLVDLQRESRAILVLVTHSTELAARFPLRFEMAAGRLIKR